MAMVYLLNKITKGSHYRFAGLFILYTSFTIAAFSQTLPGFKTTGSFTEQEFYSENFAKDVIININAPEKINKKGKTYLVLFALPNGNSVEWTKGKKMKPGDDWHFDIQHIAAQTRFVRSVDKKNNYIVAYLIAAQKSWPTWKRTTPDSKIIIKHIVDSLSGMFAEYNPQIVLNGHSGGGSFIFGYLDIVEKIPFNIERIAFLDSDYGYDDSLHTKKITDWLQEKKKSKLVVVAYNDSLVIFNGKPLVSPTGGTWYRSRLMQHKLAKTFHFKTESDTALINHEALKGRVRIILKENPRGLIYHTVQVEKNGFILSLLSDTKFDKRKYFTYFGERVYGDLISEE
jgi:hypothetical protein